MSVLEVAGMVVIGFLLWLGLTHAFFLFFDWRWKPKTRRPIPHDENWDV